MNYPVYKTLIFFFLFGILLACNTPNKNLTIKKEKVPFDWKAANIYFLLTDRFYNGNPDNDINFKRTKPAAKLRGFMGGDVSGITQKIKEGYFDSLGINAIWLSPVFEQIHGIVNEGSGDTYAFHGYWIRDWTSFEPNFATEKELHELIETAHKHDIKIIFDVVINHTGPVTIKDPAWPADWVRTHPQCTYDNYEHTVKCTLVKNLPDIKTESNENVQLPAELIKKWKSEGRYEKEVNELNHFFATNNYPRAPRYYIIKWLTDLIRKFGIDGYRVDTAKHVEESVWDELKKEALKAYADWKKEHPEPVPDDREFYMLGEVYGYGISGKQIYNFPDRQVNYFEHGFDALINFEFRWSAEKDYEEIFSYYSDILNKDLKNYGIVNYMSSHDDGNPFDKKREKPFETATKLLLSPGTAQIYYGDETNRPLDIPDTKGDATLRSFMNWNDLSNPETQKILSHWRKLGVFRKEHPAVGAGVHKMISEKPYVFTRTYKTKDFIDKILIGIDLPIGKKEINIQNFYKNGTVLIDYYSGKLIKVENGKVLIDTPFNILLLAEYITENG
jgi:alpha-amylase